VSTPKPLRLRPEPVPEEKSPRTFEWKLQLERNSWMLFGPELYQDLRQPDAQDGELVQSGVTSGTDGYQPPGVMLAWFSVVDMEGLPCPTDLAATVPGQHLFAVTRKARSGV
jgi:hypothetical protein